MRPGKYAYTAYFEQAVLVKRPYIRREWCIRVIENQLHVERQEDDRVRFWGYIDELGKVLRVVMLPDRRAICNAFLDRRFRR